MLRDLKGIPGSQRLSEIIERSSEALYGDDAGRELITGALADLCGAIEETFGKKPILIIDEYDSPAYEFASRPEYQETADRFLGEVLRKTLNGNEHLKRAVLVGIKRVPEGSYLSGIEDMTVDDILAGGIKGMNGFTHDEVQKLLADCGHPEKMAEVEEWYLGYRVGDEIVYSPWDIIKYIDNGYKVDAYLTENRGNAIIDRLIARKDDEAWDVLRTLCSGGSVAIDFSREDAGYTDASPLDRILSVMAVMGYLNVAPPGTGYAVSVPNKALARYIGRTMLFGHADSAHLHALDLIGSLESGCREDLEKNAEKLLMQLHWRILDDPELFRRYIIGMTALTLRRWGIAGTNDVHKGRTTLVFRRLRGNGPSAAIAIARNRREDGKSMDALARKMANRILKDKDGLGLAEGDFAIGASYAERHWAIAIERVGHDGQAR